MAHLNRANEYSSLEAVPHDRAANAPEIDYASATGLQLDNSRVIPEVVRSADQPERDDSHEGKEAIEHGNYSTWSKKSRVLGLPFLVFWIAVVGIVTVALALGIGLGIGLKDKGPTSNPNPTASTSLSASPTASASGSPAPTASPSGPDNAILDDTSVAAISHPDGSRRVFFQRNDGGIRQSIFDNATREWQAATDAGNITNAKEHTPLAAISYNTIALGGTTVYDVHVFYINNKNNLAAWTLSAGQWSGSASNFSTTLFPASRSLTAIALPSQDFPNVILLCESENGNATVLNGTFGTKLGWEWIDVSGDLHSNQLYHTQVGDSVLYRAPFAGISPRALTGLSSDLFSAADIYASFFGLNNLTGGIGDSRPITIADAFGQTIGSSIGLPESTPSLNVTAVKSSDFVFGTVYTHQDDQIEPYGIWINGSEINYFYSGSGGPSGSVVDAKFPFTRLATTTPANSTSFYMYHQLDGKVLAEEMWDMVSGSWSASLNISIGAVQ